MHARPILGYREATVFALENLIANAANRTTARHGHRLVDPRSHRQRERRTLTIDRRPDGKGMSFQVELSAPRED